MIRQAPLLRRLLVNIAGKHSINISGHLPSFIGLKHSAVTSNITPLLNTYRKFSITENLKVDVAVYAESIQDLEERTQALTSPEAVLDVAVSAKLSADSVTLVLKRLAEMNQKDDSEGSFNLETDPRFVQLTQVLEENIFQLSSYNLVNSLFYLLQLTKEDLDVVKCLETRLKSFMHRLTFTQLLKVAQIYSASERTNFQKGVHNEAMMLLEKRWAEILNPKDLVSMLYLVDDNKHKVLLKLEEKALELSELMTMRDLCRTLHLLAKRNRRNSPLVRSLIYHINKSSFNWSSVQIVNLLHSCSKLSIFDPRLIGKVVNLILSAEREEMSVPELSSLLKSFGRLRWHDEKLIDKIAQKFLSQQDAILPDNWVAFFLTAVSIDYLPHSVKEKLPEIFKNLEPLQQSDPKSWLDIVWSSVVLSVATPEMASSVLSPDFLSSVKGSFGSQNPIVAFMKLLNINAVARHSFSSYEGPFLSDSLVEEFVKQVPVQKESSLTGYLLDALGNMANLDKYTRTNVKTSAGFIIDAELMVNSVGELQPTDSSNRPEDLHRVAIILLEFTDMTCGTVIQPTGLNSLCKQYLVQQGYKVIQIPYRELNEKMTVVQRVQYISMKIKDVLGVQVSVNSCEVTDTSSASTPPLSQTLPASGTEKARKPDHSFQADSKVLTPPQHKQSGTIKLSMREIFKDNQPAYRSGKPIKKVPEKTEASQPDVSTHTPSEKSGTIKLNLKEIFEDGQLEDLPINQLFEETKINDKKTKINDKKTLQSKSKSK